MSDDTRDRRFAQAAQGDGDALRDLLAEHGGRVWNEINGDISPQWRSMLDADDVMQVTYMEAFLQAHRLEARDAASFVAWLRRIAKNNLRDAIKELERKKRPPPGMRVQRAADDGSYVTLVERLGADTTTPSRHVARAEAAEAIENILRRLPADYARVIRLYDLEGKPIADVAKEVCRSAGAVHMLRARAYDRLRAMIGSETDFFTHAE